MLPEHKILIDCLNNRFEKTALVDLTSENWSTVVAEAGRHRIAPLLYHKIRQAGAEDLIPNEIVRELREKYLATAYRNTVLFHQLDGLVAALNSENIPVLLLKGAHLAEFVYKDISLRPMSDLDILVKEEHLSEAVRIAFDAGFRFFYDKEPQDKKTSESYYYEILEHYKHFQPLIHPETDCLLEIHCFITNVGTPFEIPACDLWKAAQSASLNGNPVMLLSPEDLIIHLCLHTAYDHLFGFGLSALYDITITIKHYEKIIDWRKLVIRSQKWKSSRCIMLSLYFTKKWWGSKIPDAIFENFSVDKMVQIAEVRVFNTEIPAALHPHYIQWRNLNGLRAKVNHIRGVLFPSRDFMANRYIKPKNSGAFFGSYFLRFFQVFRGISAIIKTAFQDTRYSTRLKKGDDDFRLRQWLTRA